MTRLRLIGVGFCWVSLSAGADHIIAPMIMAPFHRVSLLLQTQDATIKLVGKQYKSVIDVFKRVPMEEGSRAFWRGGLHMILKTFVYDDFVKHHKISVTLVTLVLCWDILWNLLGQD